MTLSRGRGRVRVRFNIAGFGEIDGIGEGARGILFHRGEDMAKGKYERWTTDEGTKKLGQWAADGATDAEIAAKIGISRKTLYEWAKRFPQLGKALERGRERSNEEVEAALYKKCLGYTVKVKKNFKLRRVEYDEATGRKVGEREELVTGEDEVHVPADVGAQKFWLTNREPERWSNRVEFEGALSSESVEDYIRRHTQRAQSGNGSGK